MPAFSVKEACNLSTIAPKSEKKISNNLVNVYIFDSALTVRCFPHKTIQVLH